MPDRRPTRDRRRRHRRVATSRRCEAAIKTYAFFRTCPGREAVKLPIISPECASRRSGWSRPVGSGRAPGFACRAAPPDGRTHSLFTMSKNTPRRPKGEAMHQPARPVANLEVADGRRGPPSGWRAWLVPGWKAWLPVSRPPAPHRQEGDGGARRDRTDDLMLAKHALSRLSYCPKGRGARPGARHDWWAWEDSNFRPHAYQARALTN